MIRRILYDLAGADPALRFSPFCWRTRLALAHKGLDVETVPWRFTEKDAIAFSGQGRVPVLVDGGRAVHDSLAIALYLEESYPDRPSLFGGPGGIAATRFVNAFADTVVQPAIGRMIVSHIPDLLAAADRAYFVASREARYGKPLAAVTADREATRVAFRASLEPLRVVLGAQRFLGGAAPLYADHILFGGFQWARCASPFELLADDDPVHGWRERMLDAYDGLGRKAVRA
ncbi:MAG: glutathione S-transferase family protein [Alphaproteobacteria bacterium]|nr:glutathione S-transferase family protein [Alphaproteobacteria bacterium]